MYRIKELQWEDRSNQQRQLFVANTPFGTFEVDRWMTNDNHEWGSWVWGFCFDEDLVDSNFECDSKSDGMNKAQEEFERRVRGCLDEVD